MECLVDIPARPVVVVPAGLARDRRAGPLPRPSFVCRFVLDLVAERFADREVYLAPANDFGSGTYEQEAAGEYLKQIGFAGRCHIVPTTTSGYVDTRGNARMLRDFLATQGWFPLPPVDLVVPFRQARRAELCFAKEGFAIASCIPVKYSVPQGEEIVRRLWYYRVPVAHAAYELAAIVRDRLRGART